jgi:hypothetical protein
MGQSKPFRATALVVEDDSMQREMMIHPELIALWPGVRARPLSRVRRA